MKTRKGISRMVREQWGCWVDGRGGKGLWNGDWTKGEKILTGHLKNGRSKRSKNGKLLSNGNRMPIIIQNWRSRREY